MNKPNPLFAELTHYFGMGKLKKHPQEDRNHILANLRLKVFEYIEINLQDFNEDILDFIFRGLSKLGIEFDDLISNPDNIDEKVIDVLLEIILSTDYLETRYYFSSSFKILCEILSKSKNVKIFNYLKRRIAFILIKYNFVIIQDLFDGGVFNNLEEEELIQIYKNPKTDLKRKLDIALYEVEGNWLSSSAEAAIDIYIKLGKDGIDPLLKWGSQSYVDELGSDIYRFYKNMGEKIIKPFKRCINKSLLDRNIMTIDKLMNPALIELLDKEMIIEIFWKDNILEDFIDMCLEMNADILGHRVISVIRKIGGDAYKLLYKAFKLSFFGELFVTVMEEFKKTEIEEIDNLREGILYAAQKNELGISMIIILCDFLIERISREERRNFILDTNLVDEILKLQLPYGFNFNPLERLYYYAKDEIREKIYTFFVESNIKAIQEYIDEIFKRSPYMCREIITGILEKESEFSEEISKYVVERGYMK